MGLEAGGWGGSSVTRVKELPFLGASAKRMHLSDLEKSSTWKVPVLIYSHILGCRAAFIALLMHTFCLLVAPVAVVIWTCQ